MKSDKELSKQYQQQLDIVFNLMDTISNQRQLLLSLEDKLRQEQNKSKIIEEQLAIIAKSKLHSNNESFSDNNGN